MLKLVKNKVLKVEISHKMSSLQKKKNPIQYLLYLMLRLNMSCFVQ